MRCYYGGLGKAENCILFSVLPDKDEIKEDASVCYCAHVLRISGWSGIVGFLDGGAW